MVNAAVSFTMADRLEEFGHIAATRLRSTPAPGTATIEDLAQANTKAEMSRKRIEYFHSGTRLIWIVDCPNRSIAVYTSPSAVSVLNEDDTIDGGEVLPGFSHSVAEFFADLDFGNDVQIS